MDHIPKLFNIPADWEAHWDEMPSYVQENKKPFRTIMVHLDDEESCQLFAECIGQKITEKTKYVYFPMKQRHFQSYHGKPGTISQEERQTRYPIYVISKGRAYRSLTSRALTLLGIPHAVVIEPQEEDVYRRALPETPLHILPFANLGQGSIPARNWVWNHAVASGASAHWILDDNIDGFCQLNNNKKERITSVNPFTHIESFMQRYENIALTGMNYRFFASERHRIPPYYLNTRIYSCILINHDLPFRWRGRYNEDTDLSLRALKAGWCTVLFNAWLCNKIATLTMKGGNSDELYKDDGRLVMARSLVEQHPDVTTITQKWGRWQHHVNYEPFKRNTLKRRGTEQEEYSSAQCPDWCRADNPCNNCLASQQPTLF